MITIDNPMCAGTGHRICNDCMKGCIFQKQEPVNIPQTETGIADRRAEAALRLRDLLVPHALESAQCHRPYALPYNGKNVLVVGLGPAGYTLSHYLLNEGFGVVGVDGLKIEPLPADCRGRRLAAAGDREFQRDHERSRRAHLVRIRRRAEYGITVRWDKNFLTMIQLVLSGGATFSRLRRRALRRHADDRGRVRNRVRPYRDRDRCGQADDRRR